MKLISILLSFIVLLLLVMEEFDSSSDSTGSTTEQTRINVPQLQTLPKELLPFEKSWLEHGKKQPKVEPEPKKNEVERTELVIGDERYQLVGIFKEKAQDFILLKSDGDKAVKLNQNDSLPGGYTLKEINTNTIVFVVNNNRIEYKLFEFKPYDKN